MTQLTKFEERLRKEGLPHTMFQTPLSVAFIGDITTTVMATVLQFPNKNQPIVCFVERSDKPGVIEMEFGDYHDVPLHERRKCQSVQQAHDIIVAIFMALKM